MIIFGEYMYYGFGSTKLTALHNFFINFIALTYCGETQVAFENIINTITRKIKELDKQFGGAKLYCDIDLPRDGHPGRITIDRGKLRQHISYIHIYHCTKNTLE